MATSVAMMARPQRWDTPFGPEMTDEDVEMLLEQPIISAMRPDRFPQHTPLAGILQNDTRLMHYKAGEIVVREGDYGNSAFLILQGELRVVIAPDLPTDMLGRQKIQRKTIFETVAQLWKNSWIPEVRDKSRYQAQAQSQKRERRDGATHVFLQDVPAVLNDYRTAKLEEGALFGELAALGRVPRTATVFAESDATLLEIRWQGLREIRKYDENFRKEVDARYRERALQVHLRETGLFGELNEEELGLVADSILFETYGSFDWSVSFSKLRSSGKDSGLHEPVIARQGDYPDGLLMIRAGFARVAIKLGAGERTISYLGAGDSYGFPGLYKAWRSGETKTLGSSLTALGYVDVLRVPTHVLETFVFPKVRTPQHTLVDLAEHRLLTDDSPMEWSVEERFINGTQSMLIDLNRCVRCDDCVRACASTHGGNPRFLRHGKIFDHWMVANACMHCADPVCMIGCPTGAIHRSEQGGMVVINDDTCIGCGTCANSCPYDNIRMVEIRDLDGTALMDPETRRPIVKATKCDLCATNPGGPACVRACPHDALQRVDFRGSDIFENFLK